MCFASAQLIISLPEFTAHTALRTGGFNQIEFWTQRGRKSQRSTYFKYSHGQHIVDRFLEGYGWNGTHHHPAMDLVSLYVEQIAMLGFGEFRSAQRLCHAFEEVLQYFRSRRKQTQVISLAEGRRQFLFRALALESLFLAA